MEFKDTAKGIEQKDFRFEIKDLSKDKGTFSGYASVFGVEDQGEDIVLPGAFAVSIAEMKAQKKTLPMLWAHRSDTPIGGYTDLREDNVGLYCEGKFSLGVAKAAETYELMQDGIINGLSIGFQTKQYEIDQSDPNKYVRKLKEVKLFEISVVTFPMLDIARATDVKSLDLDPRELEKLLREAGFTKPDAVKAIGVVREHLQRDVEGKHLSARDVAEMDEVLKAIRETRTAFK